MATTKLTINNNGSVKIEGDFEITDSNGNQYGLAGRTIVSICRCGQSKNKPFCDGSHKGHFEHEAIAFDLPPKKTSLIIFIQSLLYFYQSPYQEYPYVKKLITING